MNTSKGRVQSAHEPRYQERPTAADSAVGTEVACPYCMVEVRTRLAEARCVCDEQATDAGLWFVAEMVTEAYLQAALRRLHAAVEGTADSASNREDERV